MESILFLLAAIAGYFVHFISHRNQLNIFKERIGELDLQIRNSHLEIFELHEKLMSPVSFSYEREKMN
jgi:hypothetical protein